MVRPLFLLVLWLLGPPLAAIAANRHEEQPPDRPLRAGMIGLDTSHVIAFTNLFNKTNAAGDLASVEVVAGFPGGTDIPISRDRVGRFTQQLRERGIEIVDDIPSLLERVDVVLLESVDGRIHLEQVVPVLQAGKPVFIDKPLAGSLADAIAIAELAKKYDVPCFSCSSIRYADSIQQAVADQELGGIAGCVIWGPCSIQSNTPDLFFYGIHGVEGLFTVMGTGCASVQRTHTEDTDLVTGTWQDGRIGSYRGIRRHKAEFGAVVFGQKKIVTIGRSNGYEGLCREIARFFQSGDPPVKMEETIEIFAFMEAADESKRRGGEPVALQDVLQRARAEAMQRMKRFVER